MDVPFTRIRRPPSCRGDKGRYRHAPLMPMAVTGGGPPGHAVGRWTGFRSGGRVVALVATFARRAAPASEEPRNGYQLMQESRSEATATGARPRLHLPRHWSQLEERGPGPGHRRRNRREFALTDAAAPTSRRTARTLGEPWTAARRLTPRGARAVRMTKQIATAGDAGHGRRHQAQREQADRAAARAGAAYRIWRRTTTRPRSDRGAGRGLRAASLLLCQTWCSSAHPETIDVNIVDAIGPPIAVMRSRGRSRQQRQARSVSIRERRLPRSGRHGEASGSERSRPSWPV